MDPHRRHSGAAYVAVLALALTGALGACRPESPPPPLPVETDGVFVAPASLELRAGETAQLVAQANGADGAPIGGAELEYASAAPTIASVTPHGLVAATGPTGTTTIRVASGRAETAVAVNVLPSQPQSLAASTSAPAESTAGTPIDVAVRAADAFGNAVPTTQVTFAVGAGDGSIEPSSVTTDAEGLARAVWTLGQATGEQALEARIEAVPPVVFRTHVPP
jgi:hypothetical protein